LDKATSSRGEGLNIKSLPLRIPPKKMLLIMAAAIFLCETLTMVILEKMELLSYWLKTLIDSSVLLLILTPVYLLLYRPFWKAQKQHEEQVRHLSRQLLNTAEEERKRIASELHDECGQTLTALQFGLQTLRRRLPEDSSPCAEMTDSLIDQTGLLSNSLRECASRLRPETLDQLGLIASLEVEFRGFAQRYDQIRIEHRMVRKSDLEGKLDRAGELAVYRVCQESLTNIAKHAQARRVLIRCELGDEKLFLQIEDDGVGFNVGRYWSGREPMGFGLLGMRERIASLGGTLDIDSKPGYGTRLAAHIPLQGRSQNDAD